MAVPDGAPMRRRVHAKRAVALACALGGMVVGLSSDASADDSRLWGETGQVWDPYGRLPDFSYAGYQAGREPIPDVPVVTNVLDFGAAGDGTTDDTEAFATAIAATDGGALLVPAGRYLIRDQLVIDRDDVVIRGEGPSESVLYIDLSFTDLNGGVWDASFSWSKGFLAIVGSWSPTTIGAVVTPAVRGDRWLELETTEGIEAGSLVVIRQVDDGSTTLGSHMHNEQAQAERCSGDPVVFNWRARVASVDAAAGRIELDDPLPVDVRPQWSPDVQVVQATSGSGIESLGIEFVSTPYPGHLDEQGYNAIQLSAVVDAWVRDVDITNADSGIFVSGKHVTVQDVGFYADRPADASGNRGHHGVGASQSVLFDGLHFEAEYVHSVTISHQAARNVFADIGGTVTIRMDHHRRTPIENLFTAFTAASNYRSGGSACEGPHAGARNTYWGLAGPVGEPCNAGNGECWGHIQSTVVGDLAMGDAQTPDQQWYENVTDLQPRNLYAAQLQRRLAIEDRDAQFSPLRFGLRSDWQEHDRFRWAVVERDGDDRYALVTTVHQNKEGDRLGEYALADTPPLGDVTVTARVASDEGTDNAYPDVCLIIGYQDDDNYDYAMFNGDPQSSAIFAVRDGQRTELANPGQAILTDHDWHTIGMRRAGDHLEMLWDGEVVTATEGAVAPAPIAGRVGVGTYNDAAYFDDIEIESPDLPEEPGDETGGTTTSTDDGATSTETGEDPTTSSTTASTNTDTSGCSCHSPIPARQPHHVVGLLVLIATCRRRR